jgi:hypothetical protein
LFFIDEAVRILQFVPLGILIQHGYTSFFDVICKSLFASNSGFSSLLSPPHPSIPESKLGAELLYPSRIMACCPPGLCSTPRVTQMNAKFGFDGWLNLLGLP